MTQQTDKEIVREMVEKTQGIKLIIGVDLLPIQDGHTHLTAPGAKKLLLLEENLAIISDVEEKEYGYDATEGKKFVTNLTYRNIKLAPILKQLEREMK